MAAQAASVAALSYMTVFKTEIEQEQQAQTMLGIMLSMLEKAGKGSDDGNEQSAEKKTDTESK